MNPVVLHVVRPFATETEFLDQEAWTIEARGMLLVDQPNLDPDTAVVFDVALANGTKVIRAEARAVGYLAATAERPGGLRVRFRRFGAQTKAFIDRAVFAREHGLSSEIPALPPPTPSTIAEPATLSEGAIGPTLARAEPRVLMESSTPARGDVSGREEPSGVHARPVAPVVTPVIREQLLARLRARACEESVPPSANARGS